MIEENKRRINQENFERAISEIKKLNPNVDFKSVKNENEFLLFSSHDISKIIFPKNWKKRIAKCGRYNYEVGLHISSYEKNQFVNFIYKWNWYTDFKKE
ncbi:MAG: hypothetical protein HG467_000650 [Clostridiales bacterium]|nr:hypothetical protein [Clostridiales bacterium]